MDRRTVPAIPPLFYSRGNNLGQIACEGATNWKRPPAALIRLELANKTLRTIELGQSTRRMQPSVNVQSRSGGIRKRTPAIAATARPTSSGVPQRRIGVSPSAILPE